MFFLHLGTGGRDEPDKMKKIITIILATSLIKQECRVESAKSFGQNLRWLACFASNECDKKNNVDEIDGNPFLLSVQLSRVQILALTQIFLYLHSLSNWPEEPWSSG